MSEQATLTARIKAAAELEGFVRVGVARANRLDVEAEHLDAWLDAGREGQMSWMRDTADVRKDPRDPNMLEGAESIVVMAAPYAQAISFAGPPPARVAKYAQGRDYHNVLAKRAKRVARLLAEAGHSTRVAVDSKPVFERAWAERAGVGFVGKNCCLIVPGIGSHVFLVCLITRARLEADSPIVRRCGSCTLCLDACPTRAFVEPRALDARRCISYLTIEHRGAIPVEHREAMGEWIFGCDVCQDVCPYNQAAGSTERSMDAFAPGDRWSGVEAADFLGMDDEAFRRWAQGSPVKRATSEGLARNAAIALGNCGDTVHLRVLDDARKGHSSTAVREAADWGAAQLRRRLRHEP